MFQCSSASRKFLKLCPENRHVEKLDVSVLFSEPKIPQTKLRLCRRLQRLFVSVLFSEPKIPQIGGGGGEGAERRRFQCSSASRKFLKLSVRRQTGADRCVSVLFSEPKIPQMMLLSILLMLLSTFQCSSASRKFLKSDPRTCVHPYFRPR